MSTRSPTSQKRLEHLTALPSLANALSNLPQAKSLDSVALHHSTRSCNPESEAKLRKALSVTSQNSANGQQPHMPMKSTSGQSPTTTCASQPQLMMRTNKTKLR